jgi:hypothetical protein
VGFFAAALQVNILMAMPGEVYDLHETAVLLGGSKGPVSFPLCALRSALLLCLFQPFAFALMN